MSTATNAPIKNPVQGKPEAPGQITSDSLAAESLNSGGDFAKGQGAAAGGAPSKSSTAANEDTSSARTIEPAADRASRGDEETYTGPEKSS